MGKKELTFTSKVLLTLLAAYDVTNDILSLREKVRRFGGPPYKDKSGDIMLKRLINKGWLKFVDKEGEKFVKLTSKGQLEALLLKAHFPVKVAWDGKWRMVIFDIPESSKEKRNLLRNLLKSNGFMKLQASVYISPYPFNRSAITYLKETKLIDFIRIAKIEELDDDSSFRKSFGLIKGNKN